MSDTLLQILLIAIPAIVAITLHEAAHGYAALAMGDDTARQAGRLSLNPLRHIDQFGTLLLPGMLVLGQLLTIGRVSFVFGWAKPVPVSSWRFADPRKGMAFVAAAGPAANFLLAWLAALSMHVVPMFPDEAGELLETLLNYFILSNLVLGLFNLIPIPPLDGGRIAVWLLPPRLAAILERTERGGILVVLLIVFLVPRLLAEFGIQFDPVGSALNTVLPRAFLLVYRLAGLDV